MCSSNMSSAEEQARHFVAQAERKLGRKNYFFTLFGINKKRSGIDEGIDWYEKAGNLFKMSKNFWEAGRAYQSCADLNYEEKNLQEAAFHYVQASKCMEKCDSTNAVRLLFNAIAIYGELGRFTMAAKLHNRVAEIREQNLQLDSAVDHYEQAAEYYKLDDNYVLAKKCILKAAEYYACEFGECKKAIKLFEEIAFCDLKTPILQYSAKDSLFKAMLCHLCYDLLTAKQTLILYVEQCPSFENTPHFHLLKSIIQALEDSDVDVFNKALTDFEKVAQIDTWHTKMLLTIKDTIKRGPNLL